MPPCLALQVRSAQWSNGRERLGANVRMPGCALQMWADAGDSVSTIVQEAEDPEWRTEEQQDSRLRSIGRSVSQEGERAPVSAHWAF